MTYLLGVAGGAGPIPALIGWKAGDMLDRPPMGHREDTQIHTRGNLASSVYLIACLWIVRGNQSTRRKPTHKENRQSPHKPWMPQPRIKPGPRSNPFSRCETTGLHNAPTCLPTLSSTIRVNWYGVSGQPCLTPCWTSVFLHFLLGLWLGDQCRGSSWGQRDS